MTKKNRCDEEVEVKEPKHRLHPDAKKSIWGLVFSGVALILALSAWGKAGPAGGFIYEIFQTLLGWGYFIMPLALVISAIVLLTTERERIVGLTSLGAGLVILSLLGLIEIASPGNGGWLGLALGSLKLLFGNMAAGIINAVVLAVGLVVTANLPLKIRFTPKEKTPTVVESAAEKPEAKETDKKEEAEPDEEIEVAGYEPKKAAALVSVGRFKQPSFKNYVPPPLSLLKSASEKPTTGDLLANANVIKRTLDSFGIPVEMGEINVGPAITRYTLKPAEGVKLSRITALNPDLALALAAHPIRIEAPIPGKSLVGVEVPNRAAALVRLGGLMAYPDFQKSGPLGFVLGRDVQGEPIFADIERMPHILVAGATGSGKSILIHSLLMSLLYKNSPKMLKLILIDPKRVELSVYGGLPHLVAPVITESKKAALVFRWAINEMERRYDLLLGAGSRDVKSYNQNGGKNEPLPYLLIVIDELADLMASYGREVEGSIVRLAQMARATGLHLVLSTQRPSVEVITGLIKANITSRVALQVASQVDSRTILDASGAEKLLGHGDLLYVSSELSKPKRIQGPFVSEEEINAVSDFIRENNQAEAEDELEFENGGAEPQFGEFPEDGGDDELYDEAVRVVYEAKKASASLLQRRLKVGYARAARLLDLMEGNGLVGPGEGAKPRDINLEKMQNFFES